MRGVDGAASFKSRVKRGTSRGWRAGCRSRRRGRRGPCTRADASRLDVRQKSPGAEAEAVDPPRLDPSARCRLAAWEL